MGDVLADGGKRGKARAAPRGPEVEDNDLALQVGEGLEAGFRGPFEIQCRGLLSGERVQLGFRFGRLIHRGEDARDRLRLFGAGEVILQRREQLPRGGLVVDTSIKPTLGVQTKSCGEARRAVWQDGSAIATLTSIIVNAGIIVDFAQFVAALVYYAGPKNGEIKVARLMLLFGLASTVGSAMVCSALSQSKFARLFGGPSCGFVVVWRKLGCAFAVITRRWHDRQVQVGRTTRPMGTHAVPVEGRRHQEVDESLSYASVAASEPARSGW